MRDPLNDPMVGDTCVPSADCYHVLSVDDRTVMVQVWGEQCWITRAEWKNLMRGGVVVARAKEARMKTKAEALANPERGDWWRTTHLRRIVVGFLRRRVVVQTTGTGRTPATENIMGSYFRRWAAGAEYLGNEGDNA